MSERSLRNLSDYFNEQFDLLDLSQNELSHGQPVSQKRGSLSRPGTCSDPMRRSLQDRDSNECKVSDPDRDSLISQKRGSLLSRPVSAPMRRSMPNQGSNNDTSSGFDSDKREKNKRGHSSLNSSCPPALDISSVPSCLSIDVGEDTDLLADEHDDGKRQRGYCKEGSLVSRFLRKLLLPSLSSLKFISDSKLSDSASKFSGLDIEKKEHSPGICDSPDAKETCGSQPSQDELEKNLLDRIEKMISCNSIASFAMCEEADEDSSDSDDNEDTVVSPIDLSNPFTETDLRSLFKALSSPLSCASIPENPTNNVSSDGIDADFDAVLSSVDLTEKCRETLKEIKKISSLENVSTTRPSLSRSINGLGPSTPDVVDSTQRSSSAPGTSVSSPTDNDIMLGKGAKSNNHPGNIRFRETVESMKPKYREQGTSKKGKKKVTLDCLEKIQAYGGRFLELVSVNPETWVVVQNNKAREKISQRIREKK
jgi:hypothetical protein